MDLNQKTETEVIRLFAPRIRELIDYASAIKDEPPTSFELTRPLLTFIKANSEQAEELLDAFGARNNTRWFPLRENVAMLKNFSNAGYELIHILHSCHYYDLGENRDAFLNDTSRHVAFIARILRTAIINLHAQADTLGLTLAPRPFTQDFHEILPSARLPRDRRAEGPSSVKNRIDTLAISVLNTTEDVRNFNKLSRASTDEWATLDFDFICETKCRSLEVNMHVLQSLYDTYISDSETENTDPDLLKLRGRITAALHLLRIATIYIHFYERHLQNCASADKYTLTSFLNSAECTCVGGRTFFDIILKYLAKYIGLFLTEARAVCSTLLRKYCVNKTVEVKVPPYIGFHVRPSSLIAAIVLHYGCDVKMRLGDVEYDAGSYPNIAMANGFLDQKKRAFLIEKLKDMDFSNLEKQVAAGIFSPQDAIRQAIIKLANLGLLRIYSDTLNIDTIPKDATTDFKETLFNDIIFLIRNDRQLGIVYDATVTFTGPEQAINDIAALANANYCESERGLDLPLPRQLDYLNFRRRTIQSRPAH